MVSWIGRNQLVCLICPNQKIKRLEKEIADLKLKNDVMEGMVDIMDNEYGAGIRKKYYASISGEKKKQEE